MGEYIITWPATYATKIPTKNTIWWWFWHAITHIILRLQSFWYHMWVFSLSHSLNVSLGIFGWCISHPQDNDQCKLVIFYKTRLVCHPLATPLDTNTCTTKDPQTGHIFNLMPLSQYNHKIPFRNHSEFLINVCKPTLHGFDEMCPPSSSICMVDAHENDLSKKCVFKEDNFSGNHLTIPILQIQELRYNRPGSSIRKW